MNKIATRIHFLMILLLIIFGNNFLKSSSFGLSNSSLIIYFGFCLFHVIVSCMKNKFKLNDIEKKVVIYFFWMFFVIALSLLGVYKLFLANILEFDNKYIIKQTLFLFLIPIAISMYICFLHDKVHIENIIKKYSMICFLAMQIFSLFGYCNQTTAYFFLLLISFYIIKNCRPIVRLIVFCLTVVYMRNIFSESTAILMLLVYIIMLMFNKNLISFFQKRRKLLYLILILLVLLAVIYSNKLIIFLKEYDANYWWRFSYWMNEIKVLKKTYFMGVGFGSTYASADIFYTLRGGFIDPATGKTVNLVSALYTTAQHNSYMNVLYRTGFIGVIFFLTYTFDLMFKSKKNVKEVLDSVYYLAFINSNIIILFNVGLESPQFILPYYISLVGLMSLRRVNKQVNLPQNDI